MGRIVLALAALVAIAASKPAAQQALFRAGVDLVELDVSVIRDRKPLADLTAADFIVLDNGTRQDVISATIKAQPLRVTLVMDISTSVIGERMNNLVRAGEGLVARLQPSEQASLVTFSHRVARPIPMDRPSYELHAALTGLTGGGTTALYDAIDMALTLEAEQRTRSLILVFSDGEDTASWITESELLESARRSNSVIHAVRVESSRFLERLAESTGGRAWSIGSDRELEAVFQRILEEMRARYVLTYSPRETPSPGWHRLDVSVKGRSADVTARPGYLVP
jgi:Ca-activated chloride channel homolog